MVRMTLNFTLRLLKRKTWFITRFLRHESSCLPLKTFKLLNKREERSKNVGKTVIIFPHTFLWNVRCTCAFGRNNKSLKLLRYKIPIHLIAGMLNSFLNLSRDFWIYIQLQEVACSRLKLHIAVKNCLWLSSIESRPKQTRSKVIWW